MAASRTMSRARVISVVVVMAGVAHLASSTRGEEAAIEEAVVTTHATGTFDVKLAPLSTDDNPDAALGRMSVDKVFHGDLEATSKGEMMAFRTSVEGSAGYVAMERVSGKLGGRSGTFVLQHSGTMTRGAPQLSVTVVPDSGTDELTGLSGKMAILIDDKGHSYEFDYTIPETP